MLTAMSRLWPRPGAVNPGNCTGLGALGGVGPGVAAARLAWVAAALGFLPFALSGCLVTDEITFDEEADLPTVIVDVPSSRTPIGRIVWLDKSAQPSWPFEVKVRDANLSQELVAHYRVVTEDNALPDFETRTLSASSTELRDLTLTVMSESLREGECHHLELVVSPAFFDLVRPELFDIVQPGREGDIDYASWTLWEGPGDMLATASDKARLAQTCRAIEDLLVPSVVEDVR
jgi:hypothetical protein